MGLEVVLGGFMEEGTQVWIYREEGTGEGPDEGTLRG